VGDWPDNRLAQDRKIIQAAAMKNPLVAGRLFTRKQFGQMEIG
jgi:hypothetical protein